MATGKKLDESFLTEAWQQHHLPEDWLAITIHTTLQTVETYNPKNGQGLKQLVLLALEHYRDANDVRKKITDLTQAIQLLTELLQESGQAFPR